MTCVKYPRTLHLPWSLGATSDDKVLRDTSHFEGKVVVVTEKMDGENTTLYQGTLHARSIDSSGGEDRAWVKQFWASIRKEIPEGWRICGENLWAKHSIPYVNLRSHFYGFSIWNGENITLSWEDTLEYFEMIGVQPVPTLFSGIWDQKAIQKLSETLNLSKCEGYVVRLAETFSYEEFGSSVAKFVRKGHVTTGSHWRHSRIEPNGLGA